MASLYLKYRPVTFDDLVDQDVPKRALRNAVRSRETSHAYLFCGPRGTGKTSSARILARSIVCDSPVDGNPCGTCGPCVESAAGSLVDIIEIDAASNRGIDEIRALRERISFAATRAKKKVYIIDEVHMLTKDAFNALLKTIEEPPSHVHFILATTEIHKVIDTIISRCQRFDFRRITTQGIIERLQFIAKAEGFSFPDEALEVIALASHGGLRDAIRSLEQLAQTDMTSYEDVRRFLGMAGALHIEQLISALLGQNLQEALGLIDELYQQGVQLRELARELVWEVRNRMMADIAAKKMDQVSTYMLIISAFEHSKQQLASTLVEQLPLELACVRACGFREQIPSAVSPRISVPAPAVQIPAPKPKSTTPAPVAPKDPTPVKELLKEEAQVSPVPTPTPVAQESGLLDDLLGGAQSIQSSAKEEASASAVPSVPVALAAEGVPSLGDIQHQWRGFCETVKKSSIKFCLREGRPVALDGYRLTLHFPTQFSMEKVLETANKDMVHRALQDHFHQPLELHGQVQSGGAADPLPSSTASGSPSSPPPAVDDVLSVFDNSELI